MAIKWVDEHFVGEGIMVGGKLRRIARFETVQKTGDMAYIDWYIGYDENDKIIVELNSLHVKEVVHSEGD